MFKLAVIVLIFVIETLSDDAELINEPEIVANAVFWLNWELLNEFKFVIDIVFADAVEINEPDIVAKLVFWVNWEPVKLFNSVNCADADIIPSPPTLNNLLSFPNVPPFQ